MYNFIKTISIENVGKRILISSHGIAIEAFLRKIANCPFLEKREEYSQKNTSLNIVKYDVQKDTFNIILLNDFSHLTL